MTNWSEVLYSISQKTVRTIVGLMSGTSLDGLDIALCRVTGSGHTTQLQVIHSTTFHYDEHWKKKILSVFAQDSVDLQELTLVNAEIGTLHGNWVKQALYQWRIDSHNVDLVASHGQTIFHAPICYHQLPARPNSTLQIGDGDHVASACNIITLADFRQRHVANGGEGAPLVLYGDKLLFSSKTKSRLLVNLGGICNFTWLPKNKSDTAFATDTGPANTLLDSYCKRYCNMSFDDNGKLAATGKVVQPLLQALLSHPFFSQSLPKTTGPELFNLSFLEQAMVACEYTQVCHQDVLATLVALTTQGLLLTLTDCIVLTHIDEVYCSGGGVLNTTLVDSLRSALAPAVLLNIDALGVNANDKEAALFAVLANECIAGDIHPKRTHDKHDKNVPISITMGKVCFPN